jgi:hypothetical protein
VVHDRFSARTRGFDHLDVEQKHADRDDQVAGGHRNAAIEHGRARAGVDISGMVKTGSLSGMLSRKITMLKNANGSSRSGKRDQIHGGGFSSRGAWPAQSLAAEKERAKVHARVSAARDGAGTQRV